MSEFSHTSDALSAIGVQARRVIDEDTEWPELARELDVKSLERGDAYTNTHGTPTAFRPMCLAYLWAETEGFKLSTIPNRLEDQPELAAAMGFDPDDLPSESTFRPARLTSRFADITSQVETAAEDIQQLANDAGSPIGYDPLGVDEIDSDDEDGGVTKRSLNRLFRSKSNDVLDELLDAVSPNVDFERSDDAQYSDDTLLQVLAFAAMENKALNQGGELYGDEAAPNADVDDPYYVDGPSGETVLDGIKNLSVDEITEIANQSLKKAYLRAKPRLKDLENDDGHRFSTRAEVAIDATYVAYYGDREGMEWVQGTGDRKNYDWCHKFATISIVGDNVRFVVGVVPLGSTEFADTHAYSGKDRSYRVGNVVRRLLDIADQYVDIRRVYADREFYAADVLHRLEEDDLKYVIPVPTDQNRIGKRVDNFESHKRGYHEENDVPLVVENGYAIYGNVKYKRTNHRVETNIVILPPEDNNHDGIPDDSPQPFATNLDVDNEIRLDRWYAYNQIQKYSHRGGIERSYSSIKECAAYTTSKEFEIRWFHFMLGTVLYNLWLLVDLLVQERIGVIETRTKPRIKLGRFLRKLHKALKRRI